MSFQSPSAPICLLVKILSPVLISGNLYSCTLRIYPQQINGATDNYTVSNVSPNFWVSNYSGGQSWRINSISNVNTGLQTLDCVIEDVEYYNYSLDVTVGQHGPSDDINGYCFQLGDNGLPNLVPIYSNTFTISQTFISDLTARFNSRNYSTSYVSVLQNGHSFIKGNFIGLNVSTGAYVLATSAITYLEIIGVVTSIGIPTVNHFTFRPFGQYLKASEIPTPLTQGVGSIYYLDSSGDLTITNTNDSNPVYIQVSSGGDGILLKYRSPSLRTAYLNNIQGSTATQSISLFGTTTSSNIALGAAQTTGNITLGHTTPASDSGTLTINKDITLAQNKDISLGNLGYIYSNNLNCVGSGDTASLFESTTNGFVTIGNSMTNCDMRIGNITAASDLGTLTINKNTVVAASKSLKCDTFTGNNATTAISLFGTTTASNIALGAGQTTGNITLGHTTPASDSGTLTINKDVTLAQNKDISLGNLGYIYSNNLNCVGSGDTVSLFESTTNGLVTIGNSMTNCDMRIGNITAASDLGTLTINKNTVVAASKSLKCDTFTGNNATTAISLFGTTTDSNIALGAGQTTGGVIIGHTTPASDSGTLTINKNTTLASGKTLTLNSTGGKVLSNVLTGTTTSSAMTIGESGDTSTVTINKDTVLASGKTLTLNSTGGKVICNTLEGTAAGSALSLFGTTTSTIALGNASGGTVTINPSVSVATSKSLACDTFTGNNATTAISLFGTTTASSIALGAGQTTGGVTIGNTTPASDSGTLTINKTTTIGANKNLTLSGTGKVTTPGILVSGLSASKLVLTDASDNLVSSLYTDSDFPRLATSNTFTSSNTFQHLNISPTYVLTASFIRPQSVSGNFEIGDTSTSGVFTIGNSNPALDSGTIVLNRSTSLGSGKTLTLNSTGGKVICNTLEGTAAGSAVSLFGTTTSTIALGNSSGGTVTINPSVSIAASKSLACDTFTGNNATTAISLFGTTTASNIALGAVQTSGNITLGNATPASDSGTLTINKNTTLASGKTLTLNTTGGKVLSNVLTGTTTSSAMTIGESGDTSTVTINKDTVIASGKTLTLNSTGGSVLSPAFNSTSATQNLTIGGTSTSGDINIGANQSVSGNITLGNSSSLFDFGLLYINKSTIIDSFKSLYCDTHQPTSETSLVSLFGNTTTGNITLGAGLTTGNITLGNTTPASDSGTLTINKNTVVATSKSLACDTFTGNNATTAISLFGTTTASNIALGAGQTTGGVIIGHTTPASDSGTLTINKLVSLPANKTITLNSTGGSVLSPTFNSTSATQALTIGGSNTTASITIGGALTSGAINLGLISQSGAINLNSDVNIGTSAVNKGIVCNYLSNFNNSDLMRFAPILTTGNVRIGEAQTTGGVTIGHLTSTSDSGTLTINKNTTVAQSKNITLGNLGYIYSNNLNCVGSGDTVSLFESTTTGNITIGNSMTSSNMRIGNITAASDSGTLTINKNAVVATSKSLSCNTFTGNNATAAISLFGTTTASNITIGGVQTSGNITLGNETPASDTGTLTINKITNMGTAKDLLFSSTGRIRVDRIVGSTPISSDINIGYTDPTYTANILLNQNVNVASNRSLSTPTINSLGSGSPITIGGNITGSDITIGGAITTGSIYLGPSGSTSGFGVVSRMKAEFRTTTGSSYINASSGNTLFSSASLTNKYLSSTMYVGANTDSFSVWESNVENGGSIDSSAICQNGNTTIFINPGDQSAFWWLDEDVMTTANNYAWVGFKFSTVGVMTTSSDVRIKRDIKPITNTNLLDKLSLIQYVNYKKKPRTEEQLYKDGELRPKYEEVHKGVIAQDVMEIFPDVVDRENEDAFWTVKYPEVDIYFNMGVQELIKRDKEKQQQIDDLTARVKSLEAVINSMSAIESRLAALESMT